MAGKKENNLISQIPHNIISTESTNSTDSTEDSNKTFDESKKYKVVFNEKSYSKNLDKTKKDIEVKINKLNNRLVIIYNQLQFIEKIIIKKQQTLEEIPEGNTTHKRKVENSITFSLDVSTKLNDSVIKYEKLVQDYLKQLTDIENNRVTTFTKLISMDKEEKTTSKEYQNMMKEIHELMIHNEEENFLPFMNQAKEELKLGGYQ